MQRVSQVVPIFFVRFPPHAGRGVYGSQEVGRRPGVPAAGGGGRARAPRARWLSGEGVPPPPAEPCAGGKRAQLRAGFAFSPEDGRRGSQGTRRRGGAGPQEPPWSPSK